MRKFWIFLLICFTGAYFSWHDRPVNHPPGILTSQEPLQQVAAGLPSVFEKNNYHIKPLAYFWVEARVLSKKEYHFDRGADLVPVDLALGWGRMSDSAVLAQIDVSQNGRFYYWQTAKFPIPRGEIVSHSANIHMIPATTTIEKRLKSIRRGSIVKFNGFLVDVQANDGWRWSSSLSRQDTGNGACELVWVEELQVY
jgi:hypothetical protein